MFAVSLLKLCIYKTLHIFAIQFDPEEIVDEDQKIIIMWDFDVGDNSGEEECKCSLIYLQLK